MDRLDAMTAFARVAESGSFTKAAQTLRLSRTTVTQLVQQLEARLRVRLLHRTTRTVKLTTDGAVYYERVVRLLADIDDAEASVHRASAAPRGRLRVDAPAPFARRIMIPALPSFRARYPDIQLVLGVSDREVDVIGDGVDCVIRGGDPPSSGLQMRRLGELSLGVHASPDYIARVGRPTHPRELEGPRHRMVGFLRSSSGRTRRLEMRRAREAVVIDGHHDVAIDDGDAYLAAGVAGLGIIGVPDFMSSGHVVRGELIRLFEDWHVEPMPMVILSAPNRHPNERLRVFVEWAASLMNDVMNVTPSRRKARVRG
jgi:DNA-binding transcriptional LysR family regulator